MVVEVSMVAVSFYRATLVFLLKTLSLIRVQLSTEGLYTQMHIEVCISIDQPLTVTLHSSVMVRTYIQCTQWSNSESKIAH